MSPDLQFLILLVVSCVAFIGILFFVLRARRESPGITRVFVVAIIVVPGGMLFARYGAQAGLPWWIYYSAPMLLTVFLPPAVFSMTRREALFYVVLAFLSAPVIHVVFSFFFGWREYMPFLHVPSMTQQIGAIR